MRLSELGPVSSSESAAAKLDKLYHEHQKTGYDEAKINKMCVQLLNRAKSNETQINYIKSRTDIDAKVKTDEINRSFGELMGDLLEIAVK